MIEPTTAIIVEDIILAILLSWGLIKLGLQFPAEVKRQERTRYTSYEAAAKISNNRSAYGYDRRPYWK